MTFRFILPISRENAVVETCMVPAIAFRESYAAFSLSGAPDTSHVPLEAGMPEWENIRKIARSRYAIIEPNSDHGVSPGKIT